MGKLFSYEVESKHEDGVKSELTRCYVTVSGFRMSYITGGQGDPVILLHGLGSGNADWRRTLPALVKHFTVYAPDMLGCGISDKPLIAYTIDSMAQYVRLFLEAIQVKHAHFIAHSMGGSIAIKVRHAFPELVNRLVLVSSSGMGREVHWLVRISTLPGAYSIIGILVIPPLVRISSALEHYYLRKFHVNGASDAPTLLERLSRRELRQVFVRMVRVVSNLHGQTGNMLPLLPHFSNTPILIIWGALDPIFPVTHGRSASLLLPCARLEVLPMCFHEPQIEVFQLFNTLVLDFLQAEAHT